MKGYLAKVLQASLYTSILQYGAVHAAPLEHNSVSSLAKREFNYKQCSPSWFVNWASGGDTSAQPKISFNLYISNPVTDSSAQKFPITGWVDNTSRGIIIPYYLAVTNPSSTDFPTTLSEYRWDPNETGQMLHGFWSKRYISFSSTTASAGTIYSSSKLPVFLVTEIYQCGSQSNWDAAKKQCKDGHLPWKDRTNIDQRLRISVGVAYASDEQPYPGSSGDGTINPFLLKYRKKSAAPSGTFCQGYSLTKTGAYINLDNTSAGSIHTLNLRTINGVLSAPLYSPTTAHPNELLNPNSPVVVDLGSPRTTVVGLGQEINIKPLALYDSSGNEAVEVSEAHYVKASGAYIGLGRDLFQGFNYIFDYTNKYIGFKALPGTIAS